MIPSADLTSRFGAIDIYVFDQLLKGQFDERRRVLDAGCGTGRNLPYFLQNGFEVFAADVDPAAVGRVRALARELAPALPDANFYAGELSALPWVDASMDAVICSAVLHFARDAEHFGAMLTGMWRVLAPGGFFIARLASTIGLDRPVRWLAHRRGILPDGSERYIVDESMLLEWTDRLGARQVEPLKTTNVQHQRCMTTWCLEKPTRT